MNNEISSLSSLVSIDFGTIFSVRLIYILFLIFLGPNDSLAPLYDKPIAVESGEYTYVLKPFVDAKQGSTSLGTFNSWKTPHTVMSYTGGLRCWGGPDRSLEVIVRCSDKNAIDDVREPSKCTYAMTLFTPFACQEEDLAMLKAQLSPSN